MKKSKLFTIVGSVCLIVVIAALPFMAACAEEVPITPTTPTTPTPVPEKEFPTKPIEMIVSWAPGGSTDMTQRLVASLIPEYLGTSMLIVNRPGGASIPGTVSIAQAKPDGYTIGALWYAAFCLFPHVKVDLPYSPDDFDILFGFIPQRNGIGVRSDSPYKTLDDLVKIAKEKPGKLTYSSPGAASWANMIGEHFNKVAGTQTIHVPSKGGRPAAVAALGGHVDYVVGQPAEFATELESGDMQLLCIFEDERISPFPDTPTAKELGYDIAHPNMMVIVVPAGVPEARKQVIIDAYKKVIDSETFLNLATKLKLEIVYRPGEDVKAETDRLYKLYKELAPAVMR